MNRFKKYTVKKHEDKIIYGDGIVDGIVLLAITELPYVELSADLSNAQSVSKAIKVDFGSEGVHVEVKVKIHFTQSVTDMAFRIQEAIRHNIEAMTDYHVEGVNVKVDDVLFGEVVESQTVELADNDDDVEENKLMDQTNDNKAE